MFPYSEYILRSLAPKQTVWSNISWVCPLLVIPNSLGHLCWLGDFLHTKMCELSLNWAVTLLYLAWGQKDLATQQNSCLLLQSQRSVLMSFPHWVNTTGMTGFVCFYTCSLKIQYCHPIVLPYPKMVYYIGLKPLRPADLLCNQPGVIPFVAQHLDYFLLLCIDSILIILKAHYIYWMVCHPIIKHSLQPALNC